MLWVTNVHTVWTICNIQLRTFHSIFIFHFIDKLKRLHHNPHQSCPSKGMCGQPSTCTGRTALCVVVQNHRTTLYFSFFSQSRGIKFYKSACEIINRRNERGCSNVINYYYYPSLLCMRQVVRKSSVMGTSFFESYDIACLYRPSNYHIFSNFQ